MNTSTVTATRQTREMRIVLLRPKRCATFPEGIAKMAYAMPTMPAARDAVPLLVPRTSTLYRPTNGRTPWYAMNQHSSEIRMNSALLFFSPRTTFRLLSIGSFSSLPLSRGTWELRSLTKMNSRTTARTTNTDATGKASMSFTGSSCPGIEMYTSASERRSPGTMSGMSATTGPLTDCLDRLNRKTSATSSHSDESAAKGIRPKRTAAMGSRMTMNGILRPIGVSNLSLKADVTGMRKMARMLSNVMIMPIKLLLSMYFARKIGM